MGITESTAGTTAVAERHRDRTEPLLKASVGEAVEEFVEEFFARTVSRSLVHRSAVSEVLVTACSPLDADSATFAIGVQLPRTHSFYGSIAGHWHDPLLVAEAVRQAGLIVGHRGLGIPLGHHFLMQDLAYGVTPDTMLVSDRPANLVLTVEVRDQVRRRTSVTGASLAVTITRDGRPLGTGSARFSTVSPAAYRRMRSMGGLQSEPELPESIPASAAMPQPLVPDSVGRDRSRDVVLSPTGRSGEWLLRADRSHPVLFDHPVDHAPGMLLAEAVRQGAVALLGRPKVLPVGLRMDYHRYVELDSPCLVRAQVVERMDDLAIVQVELVQDGEVAVVGRLETVAGTSA